MSTEREAFEKLIPNIGSMTHYNIFQAGVNYALAAQVAQADALRVRLGHVAAVAHQGGLAGHDSITALACVRQLTLPYWDKTGTEAELFKRVLAANSEAMKEQA